MKETGQGEAAVVIEHLTKEFPVQVRGLKLRAVDDLSLRVEVGEIFGLLGPNGSGKSTTIKVLLGLLEPSSGRCSVFGKSSGATASRADVGFLPEAPYFYRFLTGTELVRFYARLSPLPAERREARVAEVIAWVGLADAANRRVGTYSKGMLQRIGLAQALVHNPRLLVLDEPTAGVDPVGSAEMAELLLRLKAEGKTIILSSHLLGQIEGICDRIAIMNRGRLVLEGRVDELVSDPARDSIVVENFPADAEPELRAWLAQRGARWIATERARTTLDRIFLEKVTGGRGRAGGTP